MGRGHPSPLRKSHQNYLGACSDSFTWPLKPQRKVLPCLDRSLTTDVEWYPKYVFKWNKARYWTTYMARYQFCLPLCLRRISENESRKSLLLKASFTWMGNWVFLWQGHKNILFLLYTYLFLLNFLCYWF